VWRYRDDDDFVGIVNIENVVLENPDDVLSNEASNPAAVSRKLTDRPYGRFNVIHESIAESFLLLVVVRDLLVKLSVCFGKKPVRLHRFLARAREKTSSPSIAMLLPALKSR